jgi:thymidylate synthase
MKHSIYPNNVADIRKYFIDALIAEEFVTDKTGVKTLELVGANFHADEPTIFGELNQDYIDRELKWYHSMSLNVNNIPGKVPEIWKQVADEDGYINSNYGWCIYSNDNHRQYDHAVLELKKNRNSRRAIMIYTRPTMQTDYCKNDMSDFMCTNSVQYLIRDEVLYAVVQMRSNDSWAGYRNDRAWQDFVAERVQAELDCKSRKIIWSVGSLHIYERNFWMIDCYHKFGRHMKKAEYENKLQVFHHPLIERI